MERRDIRSLLDAVAASRLSAEEAETRLSGTSFVDLRYAKPDLSRGLRQGVSEVIYGAGKSAEQVAGILEALVAGGDKRVMVTRLSAEKEHELDALLPQEMAERFTYHADCAMGIYGEAPEPDGNAYVLVMCAGTSDIFVAEEAALTDHARVRS